MIEQGFNVYNKTQETLTKTEQVCNRTQQTRIQTQYHHFDSIPLERLLVTQQLINMLIGGITSYSTVDQLYLPESNKVDQLLTVGQLSLIKKTTW